MGRIQSSQNPREKAGQMKRQLSPSAQTVWSAYESILESECVLTTTDEKALAAALRAAADQMSSHHSKSFLYSIADVLKLQTIAIELEAQ
jgi:hypothetical protein